MDELLRQLSEQPQDRRLILMPVSRLMVEEPRTLGDFRVFPPGYADLTSLRPIFNQTLGDAPNESGVTTLSGQNLREAATSLTGFGIDILSNSPLVAFTTSLDWNAFLSASHDDDINMLLSLSRRAERAFDMVRYHLCRFDLPDTLPGVVGSWDGSGPYLGALLYTPEDHESYMIAGDATECAIVAKGLGLELDFDIQEPLPRPTDGEVAAVAVHALTLFSDAMQSSNDTIKFMRVMTLLEFLASPDEYKNWQKLKGDIVCHCANTKDAYHQLCERFRELTSIEDASGKQQGLRTLLVHHGRYLEDIVPDRKKRRALFRELQTYCGSVLNDMLANRSLTWSAFQDYRSQNKHKLGV